MYKQLYQKAPENLHLSPFPCYAEKNLSFYAWPPETCTSTGHLNRGTGASLWSEFLLCQMNMVFLPKSQSCGFEKPC